MKRNWLIACAGCLLLAGCGVEGKWKLVSIEPESAVPGYRFVSATLEKNGTYEAEAEVGQDVKVSSGTYVYENGQLIFTDSDGQKHAYDAKVGFNTLELTRDFEGVAVTSKMKKAE